MYKQMLKDNPLKEGEQLNFVGYSYGSVLQAQVALRLAESGQVIDNLVLVGSPISDKSDFFYRSLLNEMGRRKKFAGKDLCWIFINAFRLGNTFMADFY